MDNSEISVGRCAESRFVDGARRRKVVGQQFPGAPGAEVVEDGVEDLAKVSGAGPASAGWGRKEGLEDLPLSVGEVGVVGASGLGSLGPWRTLELDFAGHGGEGLPRMIAIDPSTSAPMRSDDKDFS